eukprot:s1995_g6.t1
MDLAGSTSVSDPPGAQFQTDPLVHLMVFGTQNPATGGPSGGRGLQPLATFDTRRHGSVAVSQPRSGGFGDICHKEKEPLGKSEAAQRNPGPGLDNRDEGELAENTGPSYPFPPLPPALPSYPEGAEDGYIFGANYKGDAFMGGDDFTDETEATKDSIFKSLSLPSPAVLQVDEGMAQPKSPPGRSSNSGISLLAGVSAGVSKLWRQSDDTGKPWWQSLLSSPARRMADSQNMGGKPQTPAVFRLPPAPLKKPAHAIKSKRASHQDGALKRHDLPKRATVNNVSKPTLKRAVALARSKVAVTKAMKDIELDYFANSSKAAKTAKRNAVEKILAAAFKTPMPLTVDKIRVLAGTLRDCGYKSAQTYIAEAKMTHIEGGWDWPPLLDRHFRLCIKAVNRGQGPAKKAPEVVEDAWGGFPLLQGEGYPSTTVRLAPHLFACGVQWMMREIEIANLHSKDIKFDHNNRMVTLTWNESKTDQEGATIARTLKCMCPAHCDMRCPFAVLEVLSNQACLHGNVGGALAVCHDGTRATKAQLVADWKAIFNDLVTGHSSRRSGALQYIRRGWSVSQVAFLGRWKSNVILEYAREALQTIALNSDSSPFSTLSGMLNAGKDGDAEMNLIPKFDSTNFAQKEVVDKLEEEIKKFVKGTKVSSKKLEEAAASAYVNAKIIIKLINNVGKATSVAESAAILADGSVVTWGDPQSGGDSSEVHDLLKDVQQVQASGWAFAAMLAGGSVVTWGSPDDGGDSSEVQNQLKGVQQLQSTSGAFAAILADESVVTWGSPHFGGDSSQVQDQLKGVQQVQGTPQQALEGGFAAILADGSVVTWGKPSSGGDSSEVQDQLKGVQEVQATWARLLRSWRTGSWYSLVQRQDFDALVFGAPKLLRNLHHGSASPQLPLVQEIRLPEILTQLHFSQLEFVDFCILAGCDYLPTISKVGIMTAQQLIKKHRNIENILRNLDRAKYVVPEDWNFTGARSCFQPMDLSFVKTSDLKETPQTSWRILGAFREEQPIDTVALRNLLIERHALKPDLINDHLQKLVFLRGCMQPRRALTPHADAPSGPPEHASKDSKEGRAVPQKGASRPASGCARSNARADRLQKQLGTRPPASPQLGSPLRKAFFKGKRNIVQEATPIAKRRRRAVETLQHCFGADLVLPPETPLEELERLVEDTQMEQVSQCTTVPGSSLFRCLSLD